MLLNYLIKSILTFIDPILLIFTSKAILLLYNWSIISCSCPLITSCKYASELSAILVSPLNPKVVVPDSIITSTLGSIVSNHLSYY